MHSPSLESVREREREGGRERERQRERGREREGEGEGERRLLRKFINHMNQGPHTHKCTVILPETLSGSHFPCLLQPASSFC